MISQERQILKIERTDEKEMIYGFPLNSWIRHLGVCSKGLFRKIHKWRVDTRKAPTHTDQHQHIDTDTDSKR
jgi:hypothetical protein